MLEGPGAAGTVSSARHTAAGRAASAGRADHCGASRERAGRIGGSPPADGSDQAPDRVPEGSRAFAHRRQARAKSLSARRVAAERRLKPMLRVRQLALLVALVAGLSTADARADTIQENLAKYNALKARSAEFIVIGEGIGKSIPASERRELDSRIRWGDATIRLGWYIGVLATEHYMRSNPKTFPGADGGDAGAAAKTANELYHALLALQRVDQVADAAFPPPCSQAQSLNGFFIRDDVPSDFHKNFAPLTKTSSDFADPQLTNKEMSQDQVYHVLIGLALTKHLVPASVQVKGKSLPAWAAEQAERIVKHVAQDGWIIKNPACNRDVARGKDAFGYSEGTRKAISFITNGTYSPPAAPGFVGVWDGLKDPNHLIYSNPDNLHMAMAIAAIGNGWQPTTDQHLATLADKEDWVLYPLLHRVLYGKAPACVVCSKIDQSARKMLDELPKSADPKSPQPNPPAVHGFTSSNRFIRGKAEAYVGSSGSEGYRYNGMDYMLLHNLYALGAPELWGGVGGAAGSGNTGGVGVGGVGGSTGGSAGAQTGGVGGGGTAGAGATSAGGASAGSGPADNSDESGCGCRALGRASAPATRGFVWWLLALALWRRRRAVQW